MSTLDDIAEERNRQINSEGWTADHDDQWIDGEMARAAASYTLHSLIPKLGYAPWFRAPLLRNLWPWSDVWWKPEEARRNLVKAGALIIAEIERLDRASAHPSRVEGDTLRTALAQSEAEKAHLGFCLNSRDDFIGDEGLWQKYVDTLPERKAGVAGGWSQDNPVTALRADLAAATQQISALESQMVGTKMACDAIVQSKHAELAAVREEVSRSKVIEGNQCTEIAELCAELAAVRDVLHSVEAVLASDDKWAFGTTHNKVIDAIAGDRTVLQVQPKGQGEETK